MKFIDLESQQALIRNKIEIRIQRVLDHGRYIMGPEVQEVEEKLALFVNVKHCISCSSGTDALLIPLMAKGIGPGDAVITTPFTYIATAEVIRLLGATPVFADINKESYNIDPPKILKAFAVANQKGLKPRAIIPVDLFGLPADYDSINAIGEENNLFILEDAAQGFGGEVDGRRACSFGDASATSFFPAKPLGCYGDGGAIFTNDDNLANIIKSIRVHGGGVDKYENIRLGLNGRLDTLQAAILLEKLAIFPKEIIQRNKVAEYYSQNISNQFVKPVVNDGFISSWAQYSILAKSSEHRKCVISALNENNIPSMIYYGRPLHLQQVFKDLEQPKGRFPVAENISERILSLPMHPYLKTGQQDKVLEVLANA